MTFDLAAHQRERLRDLDKRATMLDAENRRLHRLLALALQLGPCDPLELLNVLCAIDGTNPARPAWTEERDADITDRLVRLLRDTDPASIEGREQEVAA